MILTDFLHPNEIHYNLAGERAGEDYDLGCSISPKHAEASKIQITRQFENKAKIMLCLGWQSFKTEAEK